MFNGYLQGRSVRDRPNPSPIEFKPRDFDQLPDRNLETRQGADFIHSGDPAHQLDFVIQQVHREID
jgi:hypothetical protein